MSQLFRVLKKTTLTRCTYAVHYYILKSVTESIKSKFDCSAVDESAEYACTPSVSLVSGIEWSAI